MKKAFPIAALLLSTGLVLSAAQPRPQDGDLTGRVAALEDALAQEQRDHAETRELLDQTVEYLERQAESAQNMLSVIAQSEAAGFTAGINFHSRELLLAGWREHWGGVSKDVPGGGKKKSNGPLPR